MPETTEKLRTVGVSFSKLVPDEDHVVAIRDAVQRVHKATILATELLNLYVRDRLQNHNGSGLDLVFDANWLLNAFNEVTHGRGKTKVVQELRDTKNAHVPAFDPVDRAGLTQVLMFECRNLAAVASTNVWMHFRRRVRIRVKLRLAIERCRLRGALQKRRKRARRLALMQIADDVLRPPGEAKRSALEHRVWIATERLRLGIDTAIGVWDDKPIDYHLKAKPHAFLRAMHTMTTDRAAAGRSPSLSSLFVARWCRATFGSTRGRSEIFSNWDTANTQKNVKEQQERRKTEGRGCGFGSRGAEEDEACSCSKDALISEGVPVCRGSRSQAAKLRQRDRFDFAFRDRRSLREASVQADQSEPGQSRGCP